MRKPLIFAVSFLTLFLVVYSLFSLRPHSETRRIASQLKEVVEIAPNLQVMTVGNTVFLMGEVDSLETAAFLRNVVESVNHHGSGSIYVSNLTRLSEAAKKTTADNITRAINSPEISVSFIENRLLLEGIADNDFEADRAVEFAKTYLAGGWESREPAKNVEMAGKPSTTSAYQILDLLRVRPRPLAKK